MKNNLFLFFINLILIQASDNITHNGNNTSASNGTNSTTSITTTSPVIQTTSLPPRSSVTTRSITTTGAPKTTTTHPISTTTVSRTTTVTETTTHFRTTVQPTTTTKYYDKTTTPQSKTTNVPITTTQIKKPIIYCNNETWNSSCMQCIGPLCKFVEKGEQGIGLEILFVAVFISFMGLFGLFFYKRYLHPILYKNIPEDIYIDSDDSDFEDEAMPFTVDHIRKQSRSSKDKLFEIVELRES